MSAMEIILLCTGVVVFVVSFLLPAGGNDTGNLRKLADEEIKELAAAQMDRIKEHVDEVVEESMNDTLEKTELSLEHLSNEKIMAVNEYSDTVIKQIQKNHEEVLFLYDMLNDKHKNLKNTVAEAAKAVKAVEERAKEAESVVNNFQKLAPDTASAEKGHIPADEPAGEKEAADMIPMDNASGMDISFIQDKSEEGINSNEKILKLYREGQSKVAIAKELGLGVGEVKLVIDLYRNP